MTNKDFMQTLCKYAKSYCPQAGVSIARNSHMNEYRGGKVSQALIDALIVDFVNFVGSNLGLNLGFYTADLRKD